MREWDVRRIAATLESAMREWDARRIAATLGSAMRSTAATMGAR
jgi:hypothetical protein